MGGWVRLICGWVEVIASLVTTGPLLTWNFWGLDRDFFFSFVSEHLQIFWTIENSLCQSPGVGFGGPLGKFFCSPAPFLSFFLGPSLSTLYPCPYSLDGYCFCTLRGSISSPNAFSHLYSLGKELETVTEFHRISICVNLHITIKITKVWHGFSYSHLWWV